MESIVLSALNTSSFSSSLDSLYKLQRQGIKLGLEHTHRLLGFLGNPQKKLTMIHVAGTNGKGSTCAFLESIFRATGKKVGLYTSPHLIRFNERIKVDGVPIKDSEIVAFLKHAENEIVDIESTFFETTTAMALDYFNQCKVDIAIIETGLGGRLDSTNVIKPILSVITKISLDHMDILGNDLSSIAKEKAGIIKNSIPVIIAQQTLEVEKILSMTADKKHTTIVKVETPVNIIVKPDGTTFVYKNKNYYSALIGEHQAFNAVLAIECVKQFYTTVPEQSIKNGLKNVIWPGRIQVLHERLIYDVGHNSDGIKMLLKSTKKMFNNRPLYGLLCLKGDKNIRQVGKEIANQFNRLFISSDKKGSLLSSNELSELLISEGIKNTPIDSVSKGIKKLNECVQDNGIAIIFGTHYIAGEVYEEIGNSFDRVIN